MQKIYNRRFVNGWAMIMLAVQGRFMNYIGIDLHRRFSQYYVYDDETDTECTERIVNDKPMVERFFKRRGSGCRIAVEATGNWYWLVDRLQGLELEVLLANPLQTKVIAHARVKTDKVDGGC